MLMFFDLLVFLINCFIVTDGALAMDGRVPASAALGRIVNGTDAKRGEIPYIVSIRRSNRHNCGGSILDARHVLTAAHCVFGRPIEQFTVQYGILDIAQTEHNHDDDDIHLIDAINIETHPDYVPGDGYFNDVAIITLAKDIIFSDTVRPAILPEAFAPTPAGAHSILAGWGLNQTGGSRQNHLKRVDLIVYSDDECEEAHDYDTSSEYHLCAGVPGGGKGQCSGDSGGPLYADGVQVGIVSWSVKPCTLRGYPGVFVNVANYVKWIRKHSKAV